MNRMSPPWLVYASPTATPGCVVRSAVSGRCGGAPSASSTNAASMRTGSCTAAGSAAERRAAARDLAHEARDVAVEVAHAGLARVLAHELVERLVGEVDVRRRESVRLE